MGLIRFRCYAMPSRVRANSLVIRFRDRPVQPLRHLSGAGFTGLTRSPQIAGPVFGPVSSLHSPHFLLDEGLRETTVALRGHHRRVIEQLLKGCEASAALGPPASECVTELVDVEAIETGHSLHSVGEVVRPVVRTELSNPGAELVPQGHAQGNAPDPS